MFWVAVMAMAEGLATRTIPANHDIFNDGWAVNVINTFEDDGYALML